MCSIILLNKILDVKRFYRKCQFNYQLVMFPFILFYTFLNFCKNKSTNNIRIAFTFVACSVTQGKGQQKWLQQQQQIAKIPITCSLSFLLNNGLFFVDFKSAFVKHFPEPPVLSPNMDVSDQEKRSDLQSFYLFKSLQSFEKCVNFHSKVSEFASFLFRQKTCRNFLISKFSKK